MGIVPDEPNEENLCLLVDECLSTKDYIYWLISSDLPNHPFHQKALNIFCDHFAYTYATQTLHELLSPLAAKRRLSPDQALRILKSTIARQTRADKDMDMDDELFDEVRRRQLYQDFLIK